MDWLTSTLVTGAVISIGWVVATQVFPKMMADRVTRPPEQALTTLPDQPDQPQIVVDAETSIASNKYTHDVFVSEASDLVLQARVAGMFASDVLAEAADKVGDAVKMRPGSFDANMLAGEIGVRRAALADDAEAIPLLEGAAVHFATAAETKKGVIDAYVGRAWAHLERAYRLDGDAAAAANLDAAEVFLKGFRVSPQNLFILRGWGLAIDGMARRLGDGAAPVVAAEDSYRLALAEHRGGDHELHAWFAEVRASDEPPRLPMPPVRDLR